jgi:transposase
MSGVLGIDPREKVSTGVIVKAMLLNGLGFVSAPLYLFGQFFQGKATEQLLGEGVKPEHLNDDWLGNVLDEVYTAGLSELFLEISLAAANKFGVKRETAHLDSTSFHVDAAYASAEPGVIDITYGYSRDHRPNLKQFMMNLICVADGDIPVLMEIASGNQSDKARFAGLFQDFSKQWTFDGLCVADGALYSADNITAMTGLIWLTRVPLSINAAAALVDEVVELKPSDIKGYRIKESRSEYAEARATLVPDWKWATTQIRSPTIEEKDWAAPAKSSAGTQRVSEKGVVAKPPGLWESVFGFGRRLNVLTRLLGLCPCRNDGWLNGLLAGLIGLAAWVRIMRF